MVSKASARYRNFATVAYPESVNFQDLKDFISNLHVPAFISPLHDEDINPDGENKKSHWHILLMFEGKKSPEQIKELLDGSGCVGVEIVQSQRGYARYLCHLDNPEKHRYNIEEVIELSGACYDDSIGLPTNEIKACQEMQDWIIENHVYYIHQLMDYARNEKPDWYRIIINSKMFVLKEYIFSRKRMVDQEYYERRFVEDNKKDSNRSN